VGNWGHDSFGKPRSKDEEFQDIVDKFPQGLKQAMFAAASRTTIKRSTWTGCALNAAGFEVGKADNVNSLEAAAETFNVPYDVVLYFISYWDQLPGTDEECTLKLRGMIEKAGLFKGPRTRRRARVVSLKVFESRAEKKLRSEFDSLVEDNMVPNTELAHSILVGAAN
jgi:hypothetical protein